MAPSTPYAPATASVLAGLICGHKDCGALFVDLQESNAHADERHGGKVIASTCGVQQLVNDTGESKLIRLPDKDDMSSASGEKALTDDPVITSNQGVANTPDSPRNKQLATPPSSSPPASQLILSSSSSTRSASTDPGHVQRRLERILAVIEDACGQCRMCWINREVTEPHYTFRCQSAVLSGHGWKSFKMQARFSKGTVCYLCFAPYSPPFNHTVPPPGVRYRGEHCDYPDVIKELAYIIYSQVELRNVAFRKLGQPVPPTMNSYCRLIARKDVGGLLGVLAVIEAYLDIRDL